MSYKLLQRCKACGVGLGWVYAWCENFFITFLGTRCKCKSQSSTCSTNWSSGPYRPTGRFRYSEAETLKLILLSKWSPFASPVSKAIFTLRYLFLSRKSLIQLLLLHRCKDSDTKMMSLSAWNLVTGAGQAEIIYILNIKKLSMGLSDASNVQYRMLHNSACYLHVNVLNVTFCKDTIPAYQACLSSKHIFCLLMRCGII